MAVSIGGRSRHPLTRNGSVRPISVDLEELSILDHGQKPAVPGAEIVRVSSVPSSPAAVLSSNRTVAGEPEVIMRHGIGQLLGVR